MGKVLVACEESQTVCKAFRELGHEAYSCDIIECSGGHPEWHIQGDALEYLGCGWDLIIAHPPCTYLTISGNRWFNEKKYGDKARERKRLAKEALDFFMKFINAPCDRIAVENPVGTVSTNYRKPDQIIHPYYFGDPVSKKTCLWLKNLPLLVPTNMVEPDIVIAKNGDKYSRIHYESVHLDPVERAKIRSKTYEGIAKAMAEQWGGLLNE